jgi:hypothetical protein
MRKIKNNPEFYLQLAGVCFCSATFLAILGHPFLIPLFIALLVAAVLWNGFSIYYYIRRAGDRGMDLQKTLNDRLEPPTP